VITSPVQPFWLQSCILRTVLNFPEIDNKNEVLTCVTCMNQEIFLLHTQIETQQVQPTEQEFVAAKQRKYHSSHARFTKMLSRVYNKDRQCHTLVCMLIEPDI
jgi:hypothetical protein